MLSFLNVLRNTQRINLNVTNIAVREYAARKGTRERRLKLKKKRKASQEVKVVQKKVYGAQQDLVFVKQRPEIDTTLPDVVDDVFYCQKFRAQEYNFREVIQWHKETHHETVYNIPNASLFMKLDIDMKLPGRATKCLDPWRGLVEMKTPFLEDGSMTPTIMAFCQDNLEEIEKTLEAGADTAGGKELIKACQEGAVRPVEFDFIICHALVMTEVATIRGLMKKNFPTIRTKTIGVDLPAMVKGLKNSIRLSLNYNPQEPDFASIDNCFGKLDMTAEQLEANFIAILLDTLSRRPGGKDPKDFIIQCNAYTKFSSEKLRVRWTDFLPPPK